jgi:hypothetical protein
MWDKEHEEMIEEAEGDGDGEVGEEDLLRIMKKVLFVLFVLFLFVLFYFEMN